MRRGSLLLVAVLAGCGGAAPDGDGPHVVATTTQLADMARNVAPSAQVTTLLKANTDPHAYEVRPHDVKALAKADVVLRSGGETDEWLDGALDSAGVDDDEVVDAGSVAGIEGDDPHWWQDPRRAERAGSPIGPRDPGRRRRAVRRIGCVRSTPRSRACIDAIPAEQRRLVTSHDALGYFARRYGIDVVGTVIPALSTSAQPSAGEVTAAGATRSATTGVKTIFAESSVNPKVEQAIAREAGARVGPQLWADTLGPAGRRDIHRVDRGQHAGAGRRLHRPPRECARCLISPRPTSSAGSSRSCCWRCIAGVLGTWVVLRRLPFFTHAIGTATFPGLVVAGPWGVPAQLTALACAVGFGGVLERLHARAGSTLTPRSACCWSRRWRSA